MPGSRARRGGLASPAASIAFEALPIHAFATPAHFERWLAKHHAAVPAIRIRIAKKGSGIPSVTYAEALDVALAWGWIDGQSKSESDTSYLQRFGKRKPRSLWSKVNREHVARLSAAGRMQAPGLAEVERAKADGRWDAAYSSPKNAAVPDDLAVALARAKGAKAAFDGLAKSARYAILHGLETAKKPETRARRIEAAVATLTR